MEENKQNHLSFAEFAPETITFFVVLIPKASNFKMEMRIGHPPGKPNKDTIDKKFNQISLNKQISRFENVTLFSLALTIYTNRETHQKFLFEGDSKKQIWEYQIRVSHDTRVGNHFYFEPEGKGRKIPNKENEFLFDFSLVENKEYMFSKNPQCELIVGPLDQAFAWILFILETNRPEILEDMILQHRKHFGELKDISADAIRKYYGSLQEYLRTKSSTAIQERSDIILGIICLLGLLPEGAEVNFKIGLPKVGDILEIFEDSLIEIVCSKKDPVILNVIARGLCYLFVLEEHEKQTSNWIQFLQELHKRVKKLDNSVKEQNLEYFLALFFKLAQVAKIRIRKENIEDIYSFEPNLFRDHPEIVTFAQNLLEFSRMIKQILLSQFMELNYPGETSPELPQRLNEDQKRIVYNVGYKIPGWFEKCQEKDGEDSDFLMSVQEVSFFLKELEDNTVIKDMFGSIDDSCKILCASLRRAEINQKTVNDLFSIINYKDKDHFLVDLNIPEYLKDKICSDQCIGNFEFYLKIFRYFIAKMSLVDFEQTLPKWVKRIQNRDRLLENLDSLCAELVPTSDLDYECFDKTGSLIGKVIDLFREDSYREKIEFFIRKVHNEDALRVYEQLVIEEINENDLDYLTTKNTHNPLLLLHKLAKKYLSNTLVQRLIRYCLTKIPENLYGNIDYVRTHLFQEPKRTSLLYLVLQKQVFKESEIYESFQNLCCSIITEIQELKIESKWILMVDKLSFEQKTILYEQLNKVIEENSLMTEDNENKIDVAEILESYKNEWSNNISMLESFRSFINVYCTKAIDFWQHMQILDECVDKVEKKEIKNSQQFAKEIKMFDKYIKQLNPLKDSQTFEFYRKELFSKDKRVTCKEQAERTLEAAQNFKLKLIKLIENPLTTVRHLLDFFVGINDTGIKAEAQILSKSLGEEKSQWLLEILNFIEEKDDVKKLCRGLLACAGLFSLDNKIVEVVERGCRLSIDDIANEFHYVNKAIKDRFNLTPKSGVYNILTEFEGSEELLKFSLKVTVSEISLMKEAVLDSEYTLLKCDEIFYFGEFWRIVTSLKRNVAEKPDKSLEQYLSELLQEKTYFVFISDLRASKASFLKIQDFYSELMNKTEFKVNQICNIIDKSLVEIEKSDQDFDIIIKYKNSRTYEKESVSLRRMFYLQHYARVLVSFKTKEALDFKEEELNKISSFLVFVDTIEQIMVYLRELDENGYPSLMNLKVTTLNQPIIEAQFRCNQSTFDSLQKFSNQLEALSKQWKNTVFDAYEKHYSLTFFSKKEIWEVEDILTGLHKEKESQAAPFLKFLKQVKEFKSEFQIVGRYPAERLKALGEALEYVVPDKNLNLFGEIDYNIKFYIVEISHSTVIKGLLSLYYHGTPLLPKPFQVLTCSSTTSWGQLAAFTYRCFFNPNCELFCLVSPELLALELQTKLLNLLQELNRKHSQQKFKLGFITSEMQSPLIRSIQKEENRKIFDDRKLLGEVELRNRVQNEGMNCKIVTSRVPGLGKTFWIKSHIKDKNQSLGKIPISGDFDQGMFGHKMTSVLAKNVPVLCFQIGTITDLAKPLLNKFFFNLVVWRVYYDLDTIRGIPEDLQIFIEIDIPFTGSLLSEIELLQFLPTKHFEELDWEELDFESPEIQFVCHYLESLANGTIQTEDLYENDVKDAIMSKEDCKKLLSQRFLKGKDPKSVTYAQLDTFIQTLYAMLQSFSENVFLSCDFLKPEENKEASNIRVNFIESIIIAAQELLPKPIEEIQDYQKEVEILQPHSRNNSFSQQNRFSWESSTPFTIFMSSDNLPVFIYKNLKDAPQILIQSMQQFGQILEPIKGPNDGGLTEYKDCGPERLFEILFKNLSKSSLTKNVCLLCHRQENNEILICPDCNSPMLINSGDEKSFLEKLAVESVKDYVLTTDDFLKMMLIFVKIEYQIPIIISGETACGKTSLIKFLCQRILNHEYYSFLIHSGITQERVLAEMNRFILKANDMLKAGLGKKIWIVFKDFNTTECNELLSEIICERTMLGQHLPENLVLIGTCDLSKSMRNQKQSLRNKSIVKGDRNKSMNKFYYPLSGAAVSFIWDFGQLTLEMENKYIQKKLDDLAIFQSINLRNDTIELVMAAHHRMKQEPYGSPISLRDVDRYMTLLDWFINSLTQRNRHKSVLLQQAIILALVHCYYFRIDSREKRDQFLDEMEPYSKKLWMNRNDVEDLIQQQEINFIERMNPLPSGIVKNVDLLENVYTLIVCICTKIPVMLSGQSGTSKSLALQLIFNNLRGKNSRDSYFKMLPEFVPILYQNISSSVSENILDVFRRAGKYTAISATNIEIRPVVIFDGLDPDLILENNPLNAWQNKFELENVEPSFVYVSHTKCDIAEMNRAIHVALPEPDIKDYELAAEEIYKNIVKGQAPKKGLFRSLARVFSDLNQLVTDHRMQSYIGLGDYYSFLKELSFDMSKIEKDDQNALKNNKLYSVVNKNIKKSFGAVEDLYKSLWTNFCNYMRQNEGQVKIDELLSKDLITENIQEKNSRHLMLITKQEVRIECFDEFVKGNIQNKSSETLIGSDMANDLEDTKYSLQIFKKLTIYREKGYSLIFKKFTRMLPLIQDLLNNKLSWNRDKRHLTRNHSQDLDPEHLLEQGFHCIVFVSEEEVRKIHPSVLKWFEKHRIGIEDIADTNDKVVKQELVKWIDSAISNMNIKMDLVGPEMLFADYDSDFLFSMILSVKQVIYSAKQAIDYENVLKLCKDRLIKRASFDFAIKASLNNMNAEDQLALINQYYQEKGSSFKELCQETLAKSDQGSKIIVYTYTQITESIAYPDSEFVKEIILSNFNSEKSISNTIKQLMRDAKNLLVIRVDLVLEKNRMLLLHHLLAELLENFGSATRPSFMIIVHLQRCSLKATFTSILQDWDHIMIDNLNGSFTLPKSFLSQPALKKLISSDLMPSLDDLTLVKMIEKCLLKVSYNVPDEHESKVIARRENLFKQLNMLSDQEDRSIKILELVREKIMAIISSIEESDWRKTIIQNPFIKASALSPIEAIQLVVQGAYESALLRIVYEMEKEQLFDSYFQVLDDGFLFNIWCNGFQKHMKEVKGVLDEQLVEVDFVFGLEFPFSHLEHKKIAQVQEQIKRLEDETSENVVNKSSLEMFTGLSLFEESFFEEVFSDENWFEKYFRDQLLLFLEFHNISLGLKTVYQILEFLYQDCSNKDKFKFFLENGHRLCLILEIAQVLLTMPEGPTILSQSFNDQELENNKGEKNESDSLMMIKLLFKNIINQICSPKYLEKITYTNRIQSAFLMIHDKITKSEVNPDNTMGVLSAWTYLLNFLKNFNLKSKDNFIKNFNWLATIKGSNFLSSPIVLNTLLSNLKSNVHYTSNLSDFEKTHNMFKIQAQLYANLVKSADHRHLEEILSLIDREQQPSQLWKFSERILECLDEQTDISMLIWDYHGNLTSIQRNPIFEWLESIIRNNCNKLPYLLSNKIFVKLVTYCLPKYKEILPKYFNDFEDNLAFLEQAMDFTKSRDWKKNSFTAFLGSVVWVKVYLYLYSLAIDQHSTDISVLKHIDYALEKSSSKVLAVMTFVLNCLKLGTEKSLQDLQDQYSQRNISWIKPYLSQFVKEETVTNIISPLPLHQETYLKDIDDILQQLSNAKEEKVMQLFLEKCRQAQQDYALSVCIYSWFLRFYTNYMQEEFPASQGLIKLFTQYKLDLSKSLGDMGFKFIDQLLKNFDQASYFSLQPNLTREEVHHRLTVLNVLISVIALQNSESTLSSLLFENKQLAKNLSAHLNKKFIFGQMNNSAIAAEEYKKVKTSLEECIKVAQISSTPKTIYKCSKNCDFFFCVNDPKNVKACQPQQHCKICGSHIGVKVGDNSLQRSVKMSLDETKAYLNEFTEKIQAQLSKGYIVNNPDHNNYTDTKPLIRPITFRVLHFILHSALFGLSELEYTPYQEMNKIISKDTKTEIQDYLKKHFLQDYDMIAKLLRINSPYVWLNQIIFAIEKSVHQKNDLSNLKALNDFEKYFDEDIILPRIKLPHNITQDYCQSWVKAVGGQNKIDISEYREEISFDIKESPGLEYFNYVKLPTFTDLQNKFLLVIGSDKLPLTAFFLRRYKELQHLQMLSCIVKFLNHLKDKVDYRISRDRAGMTPIKDLFKEDSVLERLFKELQQKWNSMNFTAENKSKVYQKINQNTYLSHLIPNHITKGNDNLMTDAMRSLIELHNELVYLARCNENPLFKEKMKSDSSNTLESGKITENDVINIDKDELLVDIIRHNCINHYEFGKGQDIIYNFEEMENQLFKIVTGKKIINNDNLITINYKSEVCCEDISPIIRVYNRNNQKPLGIEMETRHRATLNEIPSRELLTCLSNLNDVFAYLSCTTEDRNAFVKDFFRQRMVNYSQHTSISRLFSKIPLKYVVSFYQILEETIFNKIFRDDMKLMSTGVSMEEKEKIVGIFSNIILRNGPAKIMLSAKNRSAVARMFKRLMVRISKNHVDLDRAISEYVTRKDLWLTEINVNLPESLTLDDELKLKHLLIMVDHLESGQTNHNSKPAEIPSPLKLRESDIISQNKLESLLRGTKRKNKI